MATGRLSVVAGNGKRKYAGDGVPAREAAIAMAYGMVFDSKGNLFFADGPAACIRKIDMTSGTITTIAGIPRSE